MLQSSLLFQVAVSESNSLSYQAVEYACKVTNSGEKNPDVQCS